LKQKEFVRRVQAQRVELRDVVKGEKKSVENMKKIMKPSENNLFNKICKHLPIVVNLNFFSKTKLKVSSKTN
jgi:hypothetical protein